MEQKRESRTGFKYIQGWNINGGNQRGEETNNYTINIIGSIRIHLEENKLKFLPTYILEWLKRKWKKLEVGRG